MALTLEDLSDKVKAFAGDWTKYSVVGSFALYALGYLVLRFHLTSLGIGTDLAVLDERYVFTGARFLVYLVSLVPNVVLIVLPLALVLYAISRWLPRALRARCSAPSTLTATGIVVSLVLIQGVMRQCFYFNNLLLRPALPSEAPWLSLLLLDDGLMPLYFTGLLAGCVVTAALWRTARTGEVASGAGAGLLTRLLGALVVIEFLLLPVNFGILVADMSLPRVAGVADAPLTNGDAAWLVWEGKDGITWLVRRKSGRALLTLPRTETKKIEIVGYDAIIPALFGPQKEGT